MSITRCVRRSAQLCLLACALLVPAGGGVAFAAASDERPWIAIALSLAGALAIVAVSAAHLQRVRLRRRRAAQSPA